VCPAAGVSGKEQVISGPCAEYTQEQPIHFDAVYPQPLKLEVKPYQTTSLLPLTSPSAHLGVYHLLR
jgi:hypothetical protein